MNTCSPLSTGPSLVEVLDSHVQLHVLPRNRKLSSFYSDMQLLSVEFRRRKEVGQRQRLRDGDDAKLQCQ